MPQRSDKHDHLAAGPRGTRKPYAAPRLVRYGDVAHLTRTVGPPGKLKDNPNVAKTRTT
jgi:hypothetical protein